MKALGIDQEFARIARHFQAEVIANALIQPHAGSRAQRCGKVNAGLGDRIKALHDVLPLLIQLWLHSATAPH
jgi:hypothetical protein